GDRVEAFAAAAAAHLSGILVAHVHGGDRALGQVDDSLRHAITKLAHIHFPATAESASRIERLGEEKWRVILAGSPGIDGILKSARKFPGVKPRQFALLVLHPADADEEQEYRRATAILNALLKSGPPHIVIVYPNNDPGSPGIIRAWREAKRNPRCLVHRDIARPQFLGLMRDAAFMIGNSSAGIIEAASFGTAAIDIGHRQKGRQRSGNVRWVSYSPAALSRAIAAQWNDGQPLRSTDSNVYGGGNAGNRIAAFLARVPVDDRSHRKLITH
ncbi:MAG TPA: UDP-N-acetylglucosamine 2-epimerase, partial [Tepidisphaeraceae bacterium]|nr:UDP-N-acetylglucosamine 2-epimerase [Tepidisphaeraceae bacterium]